MQFTSAPAALPMSLLFGSLCVFLYLYLTTLVVRQRGAQRVALGHGGKDPLDRAIRAHANFAEYTPLFLVLMALLETTGLPAWAFATLGAFFLAGRVLHAFSLLHAEPSHQANGRPNFRYRMIGMALTLTPLGLCALLGLVQAIGLMR